MITHLQGRLEEALPTHVVVDVGGIGYLVHIPLSTYDRLPAPGNAVRILTHLVVREDAHTLFGFMSREERDLFRLLTHHVSGIGPKLALAVLSGMSVLRFKQAVVESDIKALSSISGLGKKSAERIVVELKDKVGVAAAWEASSLKHGAGEAEQTFQDTVLALISLGYRQVEAHKAAQAAIAELRREATEAGDATEPTPEETLRRSLRHLS